MTGNRQLPTAREIFNTTVTLEAERFFFVKNNMQRKYQEHRGSWTVYMALNIMFAQQNVNSYLRGEDQWPLPY